MKIAILSKGPGNYTTKRLKEEAIKRGHEVKIINYVLCNVRIEQDNPVIEYKGKILPKFDAVIPRIAASYTRYGTAVVRQFEMQGVFTTASSIAISRSRDKLRAYQLLAKAGVGIPKTVFSRGVGDVDNLIEELGGLPVIIKLASGTHGNGVVLAETRKAAKSVLQAFYVMDQDGTNILLQEFIAESVGTDIRALVVGGRVVASIRRQSLDGDFRSNTHQGGIGKVIKLTPAEERTAVKAARAMGLPNCGVDMMRSKRGPLVLEVNSSPSIKTPERITRRNVAKQIIEYVEHNANARQRKDRVGA